jgi:hypothetical protein
VLDANRWRSLEDRASSTEELCFGAIHERVLQRTSSSIGLYPFIFKEAVLEMLVTSSIYECVHWLF